MGIQGLLPLLKDIHRKVSVKEFKGKSVGIDGYCWLHKGVYGCAREVVEGRTSTLYVDYVIKRINMLLGYDIKPVLVFDGGYLPAKASKEKERRSKREENLKNAKAHLRAGNVSKAKEYFQRCVEITPAMATEVIQACRAMNILCIVAPYEADAQLAYLEMQEITDFTISEDSDLLIYGCKKVLFKMNSDGDGIFINMDEINKVKTVALESFTMEKFRHMCILSGCDYLPSIKGLGLYKAHKYLKRSTNVYKAIQLIQQEKKLKVPEGYADNFRKTDAVFKYQSVFDPKRKRLVRLNEVSDNDTVTKEDLQFAGPEIDEAKALKIALGNLDPISGETLGDFDGFLNQVKTAEPTECYRTFIEKQPKPRNPKLHYSLDDAESQLGNTDSMLKDTYLLQDEVQSSGSSEDGKSDLSPPEKSLRDFHLSHSVSGILYKSKDYNGSSSSRFGHHSVFVKRKRHKLKNPFRAQDVNDEVVEDLKSRYFGSQDSTNESYSDPRIENELVDTVDDKTRDMDTDRDKHLSEDPEFTPDSKRVKLNAVEHLYAQSESSQNREPSAILGQEVSSNQYCDESEKCRSGVSKINLVTDKPSFDIQNIESDNRNAPIADISNYISSCKKTTLPLTHSFIHNDSQTESNCLKSDRFGGRISLFKFDKRSCVSHSKENSSQDSGTNLELQASTEDEKKVSSLHLQTRSFSEPNLQRQSSKTPITLQGRCKTIGLSRRSRSSLERVRDKNSNLKQMKIGFERFSYTKKRL